MPHDHGQGRGHGGHHRHAGAAAVGPGLTAAPVAGGIVAGSVAPIAGAMHNLSDAAAPGVDFTGAVRRAKAPAAEAFGIPEPTSGTETHGSGGAGTGCGVAARARARGAAPLPRTGSGAFTPRYFRQDEGAGQRIQPRPAAVPSAGPYSALTQPS